MMMMIYISYAFLFIIYVFSYTCIFGEVSDHLHTLHLYSYLNHYIRYLCIVLYMYFCDSNCICYLYLHYFIHNMNFILYMYFCDIICICFDVQSVKHFGDIGL